MAMTTEEIAAAKEMSWDDILSDIATATKGAAVRQAIYGGDYKAQTVVTTAEAAATTATAAAESVSGSADQIVTNKANISELNSVVHDGGTYANYEYTYKKYIHNKSGQAWIDNNTSIPYVCCYDGLIDVDSEITIRNGCDFDVNYKVVRFEENDDKTVAHTYVTPPELKWYSLSSGSSVSVSAPGVCMLGFEVLEDGSPVNITDEHIAALNSGIKVSSKSFYVLTELAKKTSSVLRGKFAVLNGTSIMANATDAYSTGDKYKKAWIGRIADATGLEYKNYAVSGAVVTEGLREDTKCIVTKIDTMYEAYPDADYVIFTFGGNDADRIGSILDGNVPEKFGSYTMSDYGGSYDTTTYCGAVETVFYKAEYKWAGKKIGFITAYKEGLSNSGYQPDANNRRAYIETTLALCKKWGIPVLNLWDDCTINPMLLSHYDASINPYPSPETDEEKAENAKAQVAAGKLLIDGQHESPAAYDMLATIIQHWMETL